MNEFFINDDGIKLHAKLDMPGGTGSYPLLVVFHGFTGHMEERHIIAVQETALKAGYATLRVELYGHGMSDGEFKNHTFYKWIGNALTVVEYARSLPFVTKLYITGHSQGGMLVMMIAGMRPELFNAILPLSPALSIPEEARKGIMLGTPFDAEHIPEELYLRDIDATISGNYLRVMQTIHPEDEIKRYHGPVLIVHGDEDELVPFSYAKKAAKLYDDCTFVPIPGDTHCYDNHLEQVCEAVGDFLEEMKKRQI